MNSTCKFLLLTVFLFCFFFSDAHAQDKYDFAVVSLASNFLAVTYANKPMEEIQIEKAEIKKGYLGPLLRKVQVMQNDGWEVFNTAVIPPTQSSNLVHYFYLRKKQP